ncbi:MAG: hypothetical protein K6T81_19800 [Alicyclobacillus macrosporangiidus]|uniref:hypothetical protein n=1 Tax=Alicyclobacillus macrosporangiidus TaxID=392015 RepID=UPI0026EE133E|nr:hypothetical protein [Alicyclobacillus macrosporangiidus]MCL6600955.1 hypothetical protein [Alicyclobacillus macrosporangiidus]
MNTPVYFSGKKLGSIPYSSVAAFLMFCEQNGFQAQWNADTKSILFDFRVRRKVVVSFGEHTDESSAITKEIFDHITDFVSALGVDTVLLTDGESGELDGDLYLTLTIARFPFITIPIVYTTHSLDLREYRVTHFLEKHLCSNRVKFVFNKSTHNPVLLPFLHAECVFPKRELQSVSQQCIEEISMVLTYCVLQSLKTETQSPVTFMFESMFKESMWELPKTEEGPTEYSEEKLIRTFDEYCAQAEVSFDYSTVIEPDNDRRLIIANLRIKNTGTVVLRNPIICIRLTPAQSMKLRGQIWPPAMAKTLAFKDPAGSYGWQYLNDDWLETGTLKGEYWISPVRPTSILPQDVKSLNNLQIIVNESPDTNIVTVEGVVYFHEQGLQVPSNNRIVVSR